MGREMDNKMKGKMSKETQEQFDNILSTMSGADGGMRFMNLRVLLDDMDSREGDLTAQSVVDIMRRFSRLIDVANEKGAI